MIALNMALGGTIDGCAFWSTKIPGTRYKLASEIVQNDGVELAIMVGKKWVG